MAYPGAEVDAVFFVLAIAVPLIAFWLSSIRRKPGMKPGYNPPPRTPRPPSPPPPPPVREVPGLKLMSIGFVSKGGHPVDWEKTRQMNGWR